MSISTSVKISKTWYPRFAIIYRTIFEKGNNRSRIKLADVSDTVVLVDGEVVKTFAGDVINQNCARCQYPRQYEELKRYE